MSKVLLRVILNVFNSGSNWKVNALTTLGEFIVLSTASCSMWILYYLLLWHFKAEKSLNPGWLRLRIPVAQCPAIIEMLSRSEVTWGGMSCLGKIFEGKLGQTFHPKFFVTSSISYLSPFECCFCRVTWIKVPTWHTFQHHKIWH